MIDLTERVAVVTGASSGIGAAIAKSLANAGMKTVLTARRVDRLDALAATIGEAGGTALAVAANVAREDDVVALFERTMAAYGRVDLVINNAGVADHTPIDQLTLAHWQEVIDINLTAVFLCAREAFKIMKRQKHGRIVNIGSVSARGPRANTIAYTATKAALDGLTHSLALDGREFGITASVLHPGVTESSLGGEGRSPLPPTQMMAAEDVAAVITLMAGLPDEVNILQTLMLPIGMPFLGRG